MTTGASDPCPRKYVMALQSDISAVFPVVNVTFIIPNLDFFRKMCYNYKDKLFLIELYGGVNGKRS